MPLRTVSTSTAAATGVWRPSDQGLIAWSYDPVVGSNSALVATAGALNAVKLIMPTASVVTSIGLFLNTAGATLTAGQNFASLYDSTGALLASTADQSTTWVGSAGYKSMALTAPQSVAAGYCFVGFYANGSTLPAFRCSSATQQVSNMGMSPANSRFGLSTTGLTTTPAASIGAYTAGSSPWWVGLV